MAFKSADTRSGAGIIVFGEGELLSFRDEGGKIVSPGQGIGKMTHVDLDNPMIRPYCGVFQFDDIDIDYIPPTFGFLRYDEAGNNPEQIFSVIADYHPQDENGRHIPFVIAPYRAMIFCNELGGENLGKINLSDLYFAGMGSEDEAGIISEGIRERGGFFCREDMQEEFRKNCSNARYRLEDRAGLYKNRIEEIQEMVPENLEEILCYLESLGVKPNPNELEAAVFAKKLKPTPIIQRICKDYLDGVYSKQLAELHKIAHLRYSNMGLR